ncbi:MAG: Unknown protein [uncultured Sulfurovum sp.]|uniref:Lipoprotein n=1 Tax=uncultured Sulfurovum sp. TaxID=269237 RepID=A0A6S6SE42_9BACT|nr:MAG: Unknown protein [uncultured Sulfurovum sp.]
MKNRSSILVVLLGLALLGCDEVETSTDGDASFQYTIQKAGFNLRGVLEPTCTNAYQVTTREAQTNRTTGRQECKWICAEYEDAKPVTVKLIFVQEGVGTAWEFESDTVSTAPNQCHD